MLGRNIVQAARVLASAGLSPGMIVGIECDVRYLQLVLILACEIIGAAHVAMVEPDLTLGGDLPSRCDLLCVQTNSDRISPHPRIIQLSPAFVEDMSRIHVCDDDLELLHRAYPASDLVRIGRTSGTTA